MERSHSCSNFDNGNNRASTSSCSSNNTTLHKAYERRQLQQQQYQQQQQQQQLEQQLELHTSTVALSANQLPTHSRAMRRKPLQRQKPTELPDELDFVDYAADLEEEEYDEHEHEHDLDSPLSPCSPLHYSKRILHFQLLKPQSSGDLLQVCSSLPNTSTPNAAANAFVGSITERRRLQLRHEESFDSVATNDSSPTARRHPLGLLKRDNSVHSDSSRYSSVDSLLEARKPDPEAILINLGFGPVGSEDILSRIPKRFLKPSQVRGIDTEAFVRRLQMASTLADHSVLGYRGLTGNPDVPPSRIVAKIMQRFEVNERKKSMDSVEHTIR